MNAPFPAGPYFVEHGADDYYYVANSDGVSLDDRESVSRLIAAAPDLYNDLVAMRDAAILLIAAVLSRDARQMLIAANTVNTLLPVAGKTLAKVRGDA